MNNIKKLQENRCEPRGLVGCRLVATMGESVTERQPLLLNQRPKAGDGSVVRIHQQLSD